MSEAPGESPRGKRLPLPWIRPFTPLVILLAILLASRVALVARYPGDFASLPDGERLAALANGFRFDLSISLQLLGIPLLLATLPFPFTRGGVWRRLCGWTSFLIVVGAVILVVADFLYFPDVHRHIEGDLANSWGSDWSTLLRSALDFPLALIGFAVVVYLIARGWGRFLARPAPSVSATRNVWITWGALVVLVLVGWWGGVRRERIDVIDAFAGGSMAAGYLALNGPFSAIRSIEVEVGNPVDPIVDFERSLADVRSRFDLAGQQWDGGEYPLQRSPVDSPAPRAASRLPNVVFLVLESWDADVTDALRSRTGLDSLGATPVFDRLVSRGVLYTNFYSHGQRSLEGLTALLASYPTLPGIPYLGDATAGIDLGFLGGLAREMGYATHMVRSAAKESFRLGSVADLAGFDTYAGAEEILAGESHTHVAAGKWGAWDFDSLRYLNDVLAAEDDPFVALFFGSSTHTPFKSPGDRWSRFPADTERDRFHNAVYYVDWAVGQFLDLAREAGYYDDTIWVITSDQGSRMVEAVMSPERFRIPALIFGPGVPSGRVDDQVASHLDLLPTIMDLAGWPVSHSSFGESLFREREQRALLKAGELVMRVGENGWVAHSLRERVGGEGPPAVLDTLEARLLSESRVLIDLFHADRVYRPPQPPPPPTVTGG